QPTRPVHQSSPWHPGVYGDVGITPAVNNPAFQQDAVICGQVPEEGAKSVRGSLHWGDLGRDGDTPGQAGFPGTSLLSSPLPAPDIPGNTSKPKGAPRKYQDWAIFLRGGRAPGRMGIPWNPGWPGVGIIAAWFAAGMWIYCRARFLEHDNRHTLVTELAESGAGDE